jgi:integrase/recombinase XerC
MKIMNKQAEKYIESLDRLPNTKKSYAWALSYYEKLVGDVLSDEAYEKFLTAIRNLSPSSKRMLCSAVMGLFEFYDIGDLSRRMKLNKHYMRKVRTKPVNFDRDGIEKIISHCESLQDGLMELRDKAFVLSLAETGLRISELTGLKRGDIDWREERTAIVGKGEKHAVVRFSKKSIAALREYLGARSKLDGESGKPLNSLPLFAQHGNVSKVKPMTIDGMRKAIKERMKEAGARVRMHDFRHYFVTVVMLASGGDLKLAQTLARHESIITTGGYAHPEGVDEKYDEIFNQRINAPA